ncbi:MAG TPA: helix-turn-helix domain-containing protein [Anaerolineae bacterium]|nr:helix-turn-helix domain-containing protein [Anaerolineae bacterium]HPL28307.1 helix-turn-helix domain-containing protein [Anaerolineae bacterium]
MSVRTIRHEEVKEELLKKPGVRRAYEDMEPAYQVARLRILCGLTQQQLAELVGTKQPNIARLEGGKVQPTLPFLRRVVEAMGGRLEVKITPPAECAATGER